MTITTPISITDDSCPKIGSTWAHYKGGRYVVTGFANAGAPSARYPLTVIYRGVSNNLVWCRPLDDWHRSMTLVEDAS